MKIIAPIISIAAFTGLATAEEPNIKPEQEAGKVPWNKPVAGDAKGQIVRPIGRVMPVQPEQDVEPQTEAIPKMYAEDKAIAMKMEALTRTQNGFYQVKLRIINPTDKPMTYTGYSEVSPITKAEHWVDGKWVEERRVLRCGTGLRQCTIAPGQSAVFQTTLEGDKLPTRIGLSYKGEGKDFVTLWSEKIER